MTSEARIRANIKYSTKTYDRIGIYFKKSDNIKERIKLLGYDSINGFIVNTVLREIEKLEAQKEG